MRRILVVANQTLGGEGLAEVIQTRAGEQPTRFTLLVPTTHRTDVVVALAEAFAVQGGMRPPHWTTGDDTDSASRLEAGLAWMQGLGVTADGLVGDHDPVHGIRDFLTELPCAEIIVSTLPRSVSRWLHQDLPHRLERATGLPVAVVSAEHPFPP